MLLFAWCALSFTTLAAAGVDKPLVLQHLTIADGLPQATVTATLRDSQGFVWFGTEAGLVRYDGQRLVSYSRGPQDSAALPGNFIWQIAEDSRHDLWLALKDAGLARWSRATDRFEVFRHDPGRPDSLASDAVRTVLVDRDGLVWVGTSNAGVSILDPATGRFHHLRHEPGSTASLSSDQVYALAQDREGDVWIGTARGLDRWQLREQRLTRVRGRAGAPSNLAAQISQITEDGSTLWIGSFDAGLSRIDHNGRVLQHYTYRPGVRGSLASSDVRSVLRDHAGNLWVGTADGLDLLAPDARQFIHYRRDDGDAESLRDSFIMSLYQDASGLLWIGTRSGGVSRWNPRSWQMGGVRPAWLGQQPVFAFAAAPRGEVWIASLAGLVRYDPASGTATSIDQVVGRANALGDRRVTSLLRSRDGTLWIGTMTEGLKRLDAGGRLSSFPVHAGNPRATSAGGIMAMAEARDGRLWLGTFGGGVNVLDPATGMVRQLPYRPGPDAVGGAMVTAILEDRHGNIWLGTDGEGLSVVDARAKPLRQFRHDAAQHALPGSTVYALAMDSHKRIWAGTNAGVVRAQADLPLAELRLEPVTLGMGSEVAYGIVADARGRMWISGNTGLRQVDPERGILRAFHREDGLQGEAFSFGAYHRLPDGRICMGGPGGFNIFDPAKLSGPAAIPPVLLTHIDVLGAPAPGEQPYWMRDSLALDYRASIVSLDFGVIDQARPGSTRLSYRLPGLSDQWIDLGGQRRITLTNLQSGNHVLEVRAEGPDAQRSGPPLRIAIRRDAAPWRRPWAWTLYVLIAAIVAALVIREQRRRREEKERAAEHIRRLAYFDPLTGLANRHCFLDRAAEWMRQATGSGDSVALVYMDLNGFKRVNDAFGHAVGDAVLRMVATRLEAAVAGMEAGDADLLVSRLGGDEFLVVVRDAEARQLASRVAHACRDALARPIDFEKFEFLCVPSVGIAVFPDDGADVATVMKCADIAMYRSKAAGTDAVVVYSTAMNSRLGDWLALESKLRRAVRKEMLRVEFQPKFSLESRRVVGAEALLRWSDEEYGEIPPSRFIEIAEDSGLILEISSWLVRAVCRQIRHWQEQGVSMTVAVNCSAKELMHGDPAGVIAREAAAAGIPASLIEVEITESLLVNDSASVRQVLQSLRALGCRIALDDFGTRYSSLSYITRFPPDHIKIDRAFVQNVDSSPSDAAVARAILSLASSLGLRVTAEGIERAEQLEWLRRNGCHEGQGFLLSRPLTPHEFTRQHVSPDSGATAIRDMA